jgi:radical SAM-linked protein
LEVLGIWRIEKEIMPYVSKPSRYIGCEWNSIRKEDGDLFVALAFPDLTEVGMSQALFRILYGQLNGFKGVVAERFFAPWIDMEGLLRAKGIPLFSLENRRPLRDFDIILFLISYELEYTNVLNMLDLGGIRIFSEERSEGDPVVVAMGNITNPSPLSPFIDAFAIGDPEILAEELVEAAIRIRGREELLHALSSIKGFYVPSVGKGGRVEARIAGDLDSLYFPTSQPVPYVDLVYDRLPIEIARGIVPARYGVLGGVRRRSPQKILSIARESYRLTGYEEIFLQFPGNEHLEVEEVVGRIVDLLKGERVAVVLPPLRPDFITDGLLSSIQKVKRTGITLLVESASPDIRDMLGLSFEEDSIRSAVRLLAKWGWDSVRVHFTIGVPGETDTDRESIADLVQEMRRAGREGSDRGVNISLSISFFVPEPHTPFQWDGQVDLETMRDMRRGLEGRLRREGVRVRWASPEMAFLRGLLLRGDESVSLAIKSAWDMGARFDSSGSSLRMEKWEEAIGKAGLPVQWILGGRDRGSELPWGFLDFGIGEDRLISIRDAIGRGERRPDSIPPKARGWEERSFYITSSARGGSKPSRNQVIRVRFRKGDEVRFVSHLEMQRAISRAVRRSMLPIAYSKGFNPRPRISMGPPIFVGATSMAEYMDFELSRWVRPSDFRDQVGKQLPKGFEILDLKVMDPSAESIMSSATLARYHVDVSGLLKGWDIGDWRKAIERVLSSREIFVKRKVEDETKLLDIRPFVERIWIESESPIKIGMILRIGGGGLARPQEVIGFMTGIEDMPMLAMRVERVELYSEKGGRILSPLEI